ncbi:hypothetical protein BB559_002483 [Furculomyces boomerangus]|uniref:DNA-(apurinic or apyrimidinic site) lyase n=2 Tax=Harpellales TaxID=61421 RepID=A0A2T9YV49_9FUNG|nr:hypothetical protein BB559_002483 [Furculomyces boomerangus]PWA00237.1 hypothetical protein BB558_003730 [Smittium angustum]
MINNLCIEYGECIDVDDPSIDITKVYLFPEPSKLAEDGVEQKLKDLGFGYRARYIEKSARLLGVLSNDANVWLESLRAITYADAKKELLKLCGVGPKVADCICLMSLDKMNAIPVDTHVMQVATRDYVKSGIFLEILKGRKDSESDLERAKEITKTITAAKSVTQNVYSSVNEMFNMIFGSYCGWAQTILFVGDLNRPENKESEEPKKKENKEKKTVKRESEVDSKRPKRKKI